MKKINIQKRVLQNGKLLNLDKFTWDKKTKTFSSDEKYLVLDFKDLNDYTFNTGSDCTFKTGSNCTFTTNSNCTFKTGFDCTFNTGYTCTFNTGYTCTFNTGSNCTFKTGSNCTFTTNSNCTFKTGFDCTFKTSYTCTFNTGYTCTFNTWHDCTFKTGSDCTFKTDNYCTFKTGHNCTFNTGSDCTFRTNSNCTFNTGSDCTFRTNYNCTFKTGFDCTFRTSADCTFKTGSNCVIVRNDIFEIIQPLEDEVIQLCPYKITGFLSNNILNRDESLGKYIIADNILSKIITKKSGIYKVINHLEDKETYLIEKNGLYAHGETLEEVKKSIKYKILDRDTSEYNAYTLDTLMSKTEAITMYMIITGACGYGTRKFVENQHLTSEEFTVQDIINITKGKYGNHSLAEFFKDKDK